MLAKVLSRVSTMFGESGFNAYLNEVQAHDSAYGATAREARSDYAQSLRWSMPELM